METARRDSRPVKHMYAICDNRGFVRYIGQTKDVRKRIRAHLWADTSVGEWMRCEVRAGRHPTVRTLCTLVFSKKIHAGICRWSTMFLEEWLIAWFHRNEDQDLLNVKGKPSSPKNPCNLFPYKPKCKITKMRYEMIVSGYDRRKSRVETA